MGGPVCGIVVAGGTGERSGRVQGKQMARVAGWPVVSWSVLALDRSGLLSHIVVVCPADRVAEYRTQAIEPLSLRAPISFAPAGATRQESVLSGVAALPASAEIVVVHDGARPLVSAEIVRGAVARLVDNAQADGVVVGHPSIDTLKLVENGRIVETVDRRRVWSAQTPQVFRTEALRRAHLGSVATGPGTDDAVLVERNGGIVLMFEGPRDNIKVTLPEDFAFVESVLLRRMGQGE